MLRLIRRHRSEPVRPMQRKKGSWDDLPPIEDDDDEVGEGLESVMGIIFQETRAPRLAGR